MLSLLSLDTKLYTLLYYCGRIKSRSFERSLLSTDFDALGKILLNIAIQLFKITRKLFFVWDEFSTYFMLLIGRLYVWRFFSYECCSSLRYVQAKNTLPSTLCNSNETRRRCISVPDWVQPTGRQYFLIVIYLKLQIYRL